MNNTKQHIKGILVRHKGRLTAITAHELAQLTGEPDRKVRLVIRLLISEGLPVISSTENPPGYFLPLNWKEVSDCTLSLRSRLVEDARRIKDIKHAAEAYLTTAQQERLF